MLALLHRIGTSKVESGIMNGLAGLVWGSRRKAELRSSLDFRGQVIMQFMPLDWPCPAGHCYVLILPGRRLRHSRIGETRRTLGVLSAARQER